jgi:hypothetical protein
MAGIFQKLKTLFVGKDPVEVYGGNKGGYAYVIFYDPKNKQILHQFITPPKQQSRNIDGGVQALGQTITGNVNYQSEEIYSDTFAVTNENAYLKIAPNELVTKYNEDQKQHLPQPQTTYNLPADKSFVAGTYMAPVTTNDIGCTTFIAHFPPENQRIEFLLDLVPEFIIKTFYPDDKIFRSSIFLHDAVKKELKMRASYNMSGDVDYMIALPDTAGAVGIAYNNKKNHYWDGSKLTHEDRGVNSSQVWEDMKSILAVPILDNNNIALGAISIDTNKSPTEAHFTNPALNNSLMILGRSIGRLLERI